MNPTVDRLFQMSFNEYMHSRNYYRTHPPDFRQLAEKHPPLKPYLIEKKNAGVTLDFRDPNAVRALTIASAKEDFRLDLELSLGRRRIDFQQYAFCTDRLILCRSSDTATSTEIKLSPLDRRFTRAKNRCNWHWHRYDWCLYLMNVFDCCLVICIQGVDVRVSMPCSHFVWIHSGQCTFRRSILSTIKWQWEMSNRMPCKGESTVILHYLYHPFCTSFLVTQMDSSALFDGLIDRTGHYDFLMCNPPFFTDAFEHQGLTMTRKSDRPSANSINTAADVESIYGEGGEVEFVKRMIEESRTYATNVR